MNDGATTGRGLVAGPDDEILDVLRPHLGALDQRGIPDVAAHNVDLVDEAGTHEFALRHPVAHETHDGCSLCNEASYEPASHETGGARDQCRPVPPE